MLQLYSKMKEWKRAEINNPHLLVFDTLALIISVIALILSLLAFSSTGKEEDLRARIKELQGTIEIMKQETSKKMDILRNETADMLEKLSKDLKKEEEQLQ